MRTIARSWISWRRRCRAERVFTQRDVHWSAACALNAEARLVRHVGLLLARVNNGRDASLRYNSQTLLHSTLLHSSAMCFNAKSRYGDKSLEDETKSVVSRLSTDKCHTGSFTAALRPAYPFDKRIRRHSTAVSAMFRERWLSARDLSALRGAGSQGTLRHSKSNALRPRPTRSSSFSTTTSPQRYSHFVTKPWPKSQHLPQLLGRRPKQHLTLSLRLPRPKPLARRVVRVVSPNRPNAGLPVMLAAPV